ncbi:uncharacterized protein [Antedon mediterranea]|uniref:uncharacterized protein isoform X2 n=1 Tax=Antedon mediterranea TaxID=105859 RepID=UPI003AF83F98
MAEQLVTKMPLAQQLNDMVKNFTLLDILSKEEQEDLLSSKIDLIRKQNEERIKRHQEIEEDRLRAAGREGDIKPPNNPDTDSKAMSASPTFQQIPYPPQERTSPHSARSQPPQNSSRSPQDTRSPPGAQQQSEKYICIQLRNEGSGLGFGLVGKKGIGVVVKTIVPGGAAAKDGRLQPGDMMVYINDTCVRGFTRDQIVDLLINLQKQSKELTLKVTRGPQQQSIGNLTSPPSSALRLHNAGRNAYGPTTDRKMEFTVVNDLYIKEDRFSRRRVSEDVSGKDIIVTLENSESGHMTRVTEIKEHKTLNVEVDFEGVQQRLTGHHRGPVDQRVPGNPAQNPREEWSEKRRQNIDRVEAEILAMREQYENQKQQGAVTSPPPHYSRTNFLDDPSRDEDDLSKRSPKQHDSSQKQYGSRRTQHSYGGTDFEDAATLVARQKAHQRQQAQNSTEISMTGKERKRYENWKKERDEIDEQRMARHKSSSGEWKREWDKAKTGNCQNDRKAKPTKGRFVNTGNEKEEASLCWGRGRGRGRGVKNEMKYSKIGIANKQKMEEEIRQGIVETDSLNIPQASIDSTHGTGNGTSKSDDILKGTDHKTVIFQDAEVSLKESENVTKVAEEIPPLQDIDAEMSTPKQPKSDLHIKVPHPEQVDSITSPDTFKTPPGFNHVINWAEEMEKFDSGNEL